VGCEPVEKDLEKTSETQTPVEARPVGLADKVSLDETDVLEKWAKVYELTVQDFPMGDSSPGAEITLVRDERRYGSMGSDQVSWDKGFHIPAPTLKVVSGIEGLEIGEIQGLHLEGLEVSRGLPVRGVEDSEMAEVDSSGLDVPLGAMIRCSVQQGDIPDKEGCVNEETEVIDAIDSMSNGDNEAQDMLELTD
jgi:hypothetical protein